MQLLNISRNRMAFKSIKAQPNTKVLRLFTIYAIIEHLVGPEGTIIDHFVRSDGIQINYSPIELD